MGVVSGWIHDTAAHIARFNSHDFPRHCLLVIVVGDSPVRWRSSKAQRRRQKKLERMEAELEIETR
jgi:hypothetical protein